MKRFVAVCISLLLGFDESIAFRSAARLSSKGRFGVNDNSPSHPCDPMTRFAARKTLLLEPETEIASTYDPLNIASKGQLMKRDSGAPCRHQEKLNGRGGLWAAASSTALAPLLIGESAKAMDSVISKDVMNPA